MWITTYNYVLYPRPALYTRVIIIRLFLIYECDKKLKDPIRRLRMLCLLTWFCTNDLQNIEFQNEQPHSYLPLLEESIKYQAVLIHPYFCTVNPFPRVGGASLL